MKPKKPAAPRKTPATEAIDAMAATVQGFVDGDSLPPPAPAKPRGEMKRFTFDVGEDLYWRIKARCVRDRVQIADRLRAILEREFPPEG